VELSACQLDEYRNQRYMHEAAANQFGKRQGSPFINAVLISKLAREVQSEIIREEGQQVSRERYARKERRGLIKPAVIKGGKVIKPEVRKA
jgi:hypothetical protein